MAAGLIPAILRNEKARDAQNVNAQMLEALQTTAGNIRSLGPAGAIPWEYEIWLKVVDDAIKAGTEAVQ